jgi:hypothetical protein
MGSNSDFITFGGVRARPDGIETRQTSTHEPSSPCSSPGVGARPPAQGGGTRAARPGRAPHGGPGKPRRQRHLAATDQPHIRDGVMGGAKRPGDDHRRALPGEAATLWMRVVSSASASVIAGRIVVSRRANIDFPGPGGPLRRTLWAERLHPLRTCDALTSRLSGSPRRPGGASEGW